MTKTVRITIEKTDDDNIVRKRLVVVGIRREKDHYNDKDIQELLVTIANNLKPILIEFLNKD